MAVDKTGNLYVADGCRVLRFPQGFTSATNGTNIIPSLGCSSIQFGESFFPSSQIYWGALGIAVDKFKNVYLNESIVVQKFSPDSLLGIAVAGVPDTIGNQTIVYSNAINQSQAIFVDDNGYIYVTDDHYSRIQKFPPNSVGGINGGTNAVTVAGGNGVGAAANQLITPTAICVDKCGNLYVADYGNRRIQKFAPGSTTGITIYGFGSTFITRVNLVSALCIDDNGNIYISCSGNDPSVIDPRVLKLTITNTKNSFYIPKTAGTYTAIVTDCSGCVSITNAVDISSPVTASVSITSNKTRVCKSDNVLFTANPINGGNAPSYKWLVNNVDVGVNTNNFAISSLSDGDVISCFLNSSIACAGFVSSTNSITINVLPIPDISFNPDTIIIQPKNKITLSPIVTANNIISYNWSPIISLDNASIKNPIASPLISTTYQLQVASSNNCVTLKPITILVNNALIMPNAFTPNADCKNDIFKIPSSVSQQIIQFSIFNRWGQIVFTTNNKSIGWDGNFGNKSSPSGTYIWQIKYYNLIPNLPEMANGIVNLIR